MCSQLATDRSSSQPISSEETEKPSVVIDWHTHTHRQTDRQTHARTMCRYTYTHAYHSKTHTHRADPKWPHTLAPNDPNDAASLNDEPNPIRCHLNHLGRQLVTNRPTQRLTLIQMSWFVCFFSSRRSMPDWEQKWRNTHTHARRRLSFGSGPLNDC